MLGLPSWKFEAQRMDLMSSGWKSLAEKYSTTEPPPSRRSSARPKMLGSPL
jgi:hypothetical protein